MPDALHILIDSTAGRMGTPFDQTFHGHSAGDGVFIVNARPNLGEKDDPRPATASTRPDRQEVQITLQSFPREFLLFRRLAEGGWSFDPPKEVLEALTSSNGSLADYVGQPISADHPLVFGFRGTVWRLTATFRRLST